MSLKDIFKNVFIYLAAVTVTFLCGVIFTGALLTIGIFFWDILPYAIGAVIGITLYLWYTKVLKPKDQRARKHREWRKKQGWDRFS